MSETTQRLIAWPEVRRRTSLSRTTVWRKVNAGEFPKPHRISANRIAWTANSVDAWIASLTAGEAT